MCRVTTAEAPRWRRLGPDQRREEILDCAVRLFGERPYAAVSTTEIARAAGVARGLLNHYFGTKRELYLAVVRRMVYLAYADWQQPTGGTLRRRVEQSVDWYLAAVAQNGKTFVAVIGAEGVGADPEVERILAEADDVAAARVLEAMGVAGASDRHRAAVRAYGGMAKSAVREWIERAALSRADVHALLSVTLTAIVRDVLPQLEDH